MLQHSHANCHELKNSILKVKFPCKRFCPAHLSVGQLVCRQLGLVPVQSYAPQQRSLSRPATSLLLSQQTS